MPSLTRRRYPERPDCWHIYHGDIHVGAIARRVGCPADVDQWEWTCGFYPGIEPGQHQGGTAVDFDHARVDFEAAWRALLPGLTETDFQKWRYQRDQTAKKYAMWKRGEKLPSQLSSTMMRCPCGTTSIAMIRLAVTSTVGISMQNMDKTITRVVWSMRTDRELTKTKTLKPSPITSQWLRRSGQGGGVALRPSAIPAHDALPCWRM
jgi:hypothetical protein